MIKGHRNIGGLDPLHQDQHRLLFYNSFPLIEKVATTAPTTNTLPSGYGQIALISSVYYLYINVNGVLIKFTGTTV